jgi:hypothetical protein
MSWIEEQYKNTQSLGSDGRTEGRGLGAFLWQQFVDEDKLNKDAQRTLNQQTAISRGENLSDLEGVDDSSSIYDVQGAVTTTQRERATAAKEVDHNRSLDGAKLQIEASNNQLTAQLAAQAGQNAVTNKRLDNQLIMQQKNIAEDRAIRAETKADELALRREQMAREDHRYAQQMERYDKRKRQDSIQAMVAGLASLGAAFAL